MAEAIIHSYSAVQTFKQCPHKYKKVKLDKEFFEQSGPESEFGDKQHNLAENALQDDTPLAGPMGDALDFVRSFTGLKIAEQMLGIDVNLKPCGFFEKERVWYRAKVDVTILNQDHAVIIDYKTGKRRVPWEKRHDPDAIPDEDQMLIYALLTFLTHKYINTIEAYLYYTHNGSPPDKYTFHRRDDAKRMVTAIREDTYRAERKLRKGPNATWKKNDTPLCGYCPVVTCEYWRKPRKK